MYNSEKRARIEFYLKEKSDAVEIIDRVHLIYNDVDYSITSFMRTFFKGEPFGKKDNLTGEEILKIVDEYAQKLYPDEYHQLEMDSAVHTALMGDHNTWLRKLLIFLGRFFIVYDITSWDVDVNLGVLSFIPESGSLKSVVRQDIIEEKKK